MLSQMLGDLLLEGRDQALNGRVIAGIAAQEDQVLTVLMM